MYEIVDVWNRGCMERVYGIEDLRKNFYKIISISSVFN